MGRDETMSPGIVMWAMDQVADRYAQKDGQTLKAAGEQQLQTPKQPLTAKALRLNHPA